MIEVKELSAGFEKPVLDKLSVTIHDGEFSVLIGENGSGKTTFLRTLVGLTQISKGSVLVNGHDPVNPRELPLILNDVGFLFQDPEDQIVALTVEEEVAFGLGRLSLGEAEIEERVLEALRLVDLSQHRYRLTMELSGGEKQRLALAALLAVRPGILLLDEPTSLLDPPSRLRLRKILESLHEKGKTILMVTQDLEEVLWGDRVLLLRDGKMDSIEKPVEIFSNPEFLSMRGLEIPYGVRLDLLLQKFQEKHPELAALLTA